MTTAPMPTADCTALAQAIMRIADIPRHPDVVEQFRLYQEGLAKIERERASYREFLLLVAERHGFRRSDLPKWSGEPLKGGPVKHFSTAEIGTLDKTGLMWERFRMDLWHHCLALAEDIFWYLLWLRFRLGVVGRMEQHGDTVFRFDISLFRFNYTALDLSIGYVVCCQLDSKVVDLIDARVVPLASAGSPPAIRALIREVPESFRSLSFVLEGMQVREATSRCYFSDLSVRGEGWPGSSVLPAADGVPVLRRTEALVAFGYVLAHWHVTPLSWAQVWRVARPAVPPVALLLVLALLWLLTGLWVPDPLPDRPPWLYVFCHVLMFWGTVCFLIMGTGAVFRHSTGTVCQERDWTGRNMVGFGYACRAFWIWWYCNKN